jgi:hypothetical protein
MATANCPYASNNVLVVTTSHAGTLITAPSHVIVFCPK